MRYRNEAYHTICEANGQRLGAVCRLGHGVGWASSPAEAKFDTGKNIPGRTQVGGSDPAAGPRKTALATLDE